MGKYEPCARGTMRRTVWDGTQELYEIQMLGGWGDGLDSGVENDTLPVFMGLLWGETTQLDHNRVFGRVAYTHGPGLDQPLSVTRINLTDIYYDQPRVDWPPLTIVPHWTWRGRADYGTMADGGWKTCENPSSSRCVSVVWVGKELAFLHQTPDTRWWGTLLVDKEDGTGTLFRRNRYVEPATGRFTQEDPIGLAGGLNLYGFAAGDPVNFSDPFGLTCLIRGNCLQSDGGLVELHNEAKIAQLHASFQGVARNVLRNAALNGVTGHINVAMRSSADQARARAEGKSNVDEGYHQYGMAIDVYPWKNGRVDYSDGDEQKVLGHSGEGLGLTWGGRWTDPYDPGHLEMRSHTISELRQLRKDGQWKLPQDP